MTSFRKFSINRVFLVYMVLIGCLSTLSVGYLWIQSEWSRFDHETAQMRTSYLEERQALLKQEVRQALDYVTYMQTQTTLRLQDSIKNRVYEAYAIAENIYLQQRHTRSIADIETAIKDALRPILFNNGRGYYFALTMEGI